MKNVIERNAVLMALATGLIALAGAGCESQPTVDANDNAPPGFRRVHQQGRDGGVQGFRPSGLGDFKISGGSQSN